MEKWLCHFGNSFNAEYSKRGILERSEENSTGAECGSLGCFNKSRFGKTQHQQAFTLAEVLITLSIIGIVAALTIPSLITNNQEKQTVVQLKKTYNIFSNAFSLATIEYGDPSEWGLEESTLKGSSAMFEKFEPFLNIIKKCEGTKGCFSPGMYKYLNGGDFGEFDIGTKNCKGILADGTSFTYWASSPECSYVFGSNEKLSHSCGVLTVDINGFKKPNQMGIDMFEFRVTKDGIVPTGTKGDTTPLDMHCNKSSGYGHSCTAWVILKENMDYLRKNVSWD